MSITLIIREALEARPRPLGELSRPHKTKRYSFDPNDALVLAGNI